MFLKNHVYFVQIKTCISMALLQMLHVNKKLRSTKQFHFIERNIFRLKLFLKKSEYFEILQKHRQKIWKHITCFYQVTCQKIFIRTKRYLYLKGLKFFGNEHNFSENTKLKNISFLYFIESTFFEVYNNLYYC